jgi:hypothetical protein
MPPDQPSAQPWVTSDRPIPRLLVALSASSWTPKHTDLSIRLGPFEFVYAPPHGEFAQPRATAARRTIPLAG